MSFKLDIINLPSELVLVAYLGFLLKQRESFSDLSCRKTWTFAFGLSVNASKTTPWIDRLSKLSPVENETRNSFKIFPSFKSLMELFKLIQYVVFFLRLSFVSSVNVFFLIL